MFRQWMAAEQFYTFTLPAIAIAMIILSGVYLFILIYTDRKTRAQKIGHLVFFSLLTPALVYGLWAHQSHNFWLDQNDYIHPGIRDRATIFGMETHEDPAIASAYRRSESLGENLTQLEMYEDEEVTRDFPYTYVGSNGSQHYFSHGEDDAYTFRLDGVVHWSEDSNYLIGREHRLVDEQFEDIGFYNEHHIIFEALHLTDDEQEVDPSRMENYYSVTDMIGGWLFGRQFY